jgi:DNA-binding MarR family transcriptional regulator
MKMERHRDMGSALREVATTCLCQKARHAARAITRFYDRHFAGTGMEPTQFNLLVAIGLSGPVSLVRLATYLGLERTTLTRNLGLLQRAGWVEIQTGGDARQRLLSITKTGQRALQRAMPRWRRAQQAAVSALGKEDFARLSQTLSLPDKLMDSPKKSIKQNVYEK